MNENSLKLFDLIKEHNEFIHSLLCENENIVSNIRYAIPDIYLPEGAPYIFIDFVSYGELSDETISRFEEKGIKFMVTRNKSEFVVYHFKIRAKVE